MNHARGMWKFDALMLLSLVVALAFGGPKTEVDDAQETAALERAAYERKADVTPEERLTLTHPLDCDATVCTRQSSREKCLTRTRCYSKSAQ